MNTLLFLVFVAGSTIFGLIMSCMIGSLTPWISILGFAFGAFCVWWTRRQNIGRERGRPFPSLLNWDPSALVLLFVVIVIVYQSLYLMFPMDRSLHIGNSNNAGDLPFHINMMKAFARGLHFWPENLEYAGESLRYPFGLDLFGAMCESVGIPLAIHLTLVTMIGSWLILCELWNWGGTFLVLGFFASGGVIAWGQMLSGNEAYPGSPLDFKNLFISCIIPQRSLLFAVPLGIFLIRHFAARAPAEPAARPGGLWDRLRFSGDSLILILLFATLPIFHLHTFAFLGLYFLGKCLFKWCQGDREGARELLRHLVWVFVLSTPLLWKLLAHGSQLGGALGWMGLWNFHEVPAVSSPVVYLIGNFISLIPLIAYLVYDAIVRRRVEDLWPVLLFVLFLFIKVAPWAWDNIKVLMWAYMLIVAAFWNQVKTWQYFQSSWVRTGFAILLFFPGFMQLASGLPAAGKGSELMSDQYWAECLQPNFDVNESVVIDPDYKHPLLWAGVKTPLGFEGHVWAHGYSLEPRHSQTQALLQQTPDWAESAKQLHARWLYSSHPLTSPDWTGRNSKPACIDKPHRGDRLYEL